MSVQHKGTVIPILIVGDVGDCWEAYVAGGLKRIPKELFHASSLAQHDHRTTNNKGCLPK